MWQWFIKEFKEADWFYKFLLISLIFSFNYAFFSKNEQIIRSLSDILALGLFVAMQVFFIFILLAFNAKGGSIEWPGADTYEARKFYSNIISRGGIIISLIILLLPH